MASLTGGFAPISGAGASKDKGGAKKNDLTGGLISLGGNGGSHSRSKNDDLDFSDFDVDDLLLDDAGGGSKSKSKSKSKSPSSSPTKKKSSSSGSSGSKKKKDKDKKKSSGGALDFLNEDDDDWDKDDDDVGARSKKTTKAFDFDEVVVPAKKKNAKLDDEFARMLGLEDDFADRNATMSSVTNDDGDVSPFGDSPVKRDTYAPTVTRKDRSPEPSMKQKASSPSPDEMDGNHSGIGGIDSSFFQDEPAAQGSKAIDTDDDFLSLLSSTSSSERRNGRGGGGRRGAGAAGDDRSSKSLFADPFDKSYASTTSSRRAGGLDGLFSSSSSRAAAKPAPADPLESESLPPATKAPAAKSTFASLFGNDDRPKKLEDADSSASTQPVSRSLSTKPAASTLMAKDDLLAELFPTEPPRAASKKAPSPVKDENAQQDDLLAELFPVETIKSSRQREPEPTRRASPPPPQDVSVVEPKASPPSPPLPTKSVDSRKPDTAANDVDSARDSLLKDLLPDSPPRARRRSPLRFDEASDKAAGTTQQRLGTSSSLQGPPPTSHQGSSPPAMTVAVDPTPPKPSQLSPVKPPPPKLESPLPSPGKTKTLTLGTPSKVREVEFEQTKDDLLEEILSSAPSSPLQRAPEVTNTTSGHSNGPTSPRSRRSSYSLSFDQDAGAASSTVEPLESPPPTNVAGRRRASRSPEKQDATATSAAPAVATTAVTQTVFLRDVQAEEELKTQHAADLAAMETRHAEALARAASDAHQLQSQLLQEQVNTVAQAKASESHMQQLQQLQDELAQARTAHMTLTSELQSLKTQHTLQQTQCGLFDREKAALLRQLSLAEEQQRVLVTQLAQEKLAHQQTQLAFAEFKRETDQAAQLRTEKERAQMDRLYHQLQNSLAQLTVLQEHGSEEATAKRELEASTRLRMISSLETTSRGYAQQTQDECHRLTSLLSGLEATLRAFRQEHLEEKERLRQEQTRLNVLAQHFQAQTSVLNEKSDANAQLLAQHLGASLQDTRAAEARLALRRQQLADDEQKLYSERAVFASHREAWLEQRQREAAELEAQRTAIEREWRALQRERDDLEDVIASHEDAFHAMQQQQLMLEAEKDRVAVGALHVADMAQKFEQLTKTLVDKEHAIQQQRAEMDEMQRQWATREQSVSSERRKVDEREARLHAQLKQMETSRRKMNDERRQQLQHLHSQQRQRTETTNVHATAMRPPVARTADVMAAATTTVGGVRAHVTLGRTVNSSTRVSSSSYSSSSSMPLGMQWTSATASHPLRQTEAACDLTKASPSSTPLDPAGFSPSFRQLIEENWRNEPRVTDTALHRERMAIHCLGLDTSRDRARRDNQRGDNQFDTHQHHRLHQAHSSYIMPTGTKATTTTTTSMTATPTATTTAAGAGARMTHSGVVKPPPPPPPPTAFSASSSASSSSSSQTASRILSVHL